MYNILQYGSESLLHTNRLHYIPQAKKAKGQGLFL